MISTTPNAGKKRNAIQTGVYQFVCGLGQANAKTRSTPYYAKNLVKNSKAVPEGILEALMVWYYIKLSTAFMFQCKEDLPSGINSIGS